MTDVALSYDQALARIVSLEAALSAAQAVASELTTVHRQSQMPPALDDLFHTMLARTCTALQADYGYTLLTDQAAQTVTVAAAVGVQTEVIAGYRLPVLGTVMGTVVAQGQALRINDTASLPQFFDDIDQRVGTPTRSLLVAPLRVQGRVQGAVIVTNKRNAAAGFSVDDLNLLISLSQLLAAAIENTRLLDQVHTYSRDLASAVQDRTAHLSAVIQTSRAISRIVTMDELFAVVTRQISRLLNRARVSIALRTGGYLIFQHVDDGALKPRVIPENHRLRLDRQHVLGAVIFNGEAANLETISTAALYNLPEDDDPVAAALALPLTIGGKTTGVIVAQNQTWPPSLANDLETLGALASQTAVALENARLLSQSREMAIIDERNRLARDMHDGIAQNLAYLLIQVDRCLTMAETSNPGLAPALENLGDVIAGNIEELRRHIFDLRPLGLERGSFPRALKQICREFSEQMDVPTTCQVLGGEPDLAPEIDISLYRILQEALANIRRHAQASQVWITFHSSYDALQLSVHDNGVGFIPAQVSVNAFQQHGMGLASIRERVRSLGGALLLQSAPGEGTVLQVNIPNF